MLKNLLSNAFKFTDSGRVECAISMDHGDAARFGSQALRRAPAVVAFAVSDTGIGIADDKKQVIFEAFQQADASTSRTYGGTGLGLTISRELARLMGGEIFLESAPGVGSTFTLYLALAEIDRSYPASHEEAGPYERSHQEPAQAPRVETLTPEQEPAQQLQPASSAPAARQVPGEAGDLHGRKVLVVDDDVRNLFAVTSLLERHGMKVVPAGSGQEAIEELENEPGIDLVLMDVMMPEMDGYQATREIRSRQRFQALPIVALTAKAMPGDREKTIEAGCNDFVPKPVESDRLLSTIRAWLTKPAKDEDKG